MTKNKEFDKKGWELHEISISKQFEDFDILIEKREDRFVVEIYELLPNFPNLLKKLTTRTFDQAQEAAQYLYKEYVKKS